MEWHAARPPAPSTAPTSDDEGEWPTTREEPVREPARGVRRRGRWYGWQILLTDTAAIASFAAFSSVGVRGASWAYLGLTLYAGGGPILHLAHGSGEKAAGSVGLRLGLPLGGALLGWGIGAAGGGTNTNCGALFCPPLVGAALGFVLGMIVAPIVDIAALAFDVGPPRSHASPAPRLQFAPVAALPRDSAGHVAPTFGLVGSF